MVRQSFLPSWSSSLCHPLVFSLPTLLMTKFSKSNLLCSFLLFFLLLNWSTLNNMMSLFRKFLNRFTPINISSQALGILLLVTFGISPKDVTTLRVVFLLSSLRHLLRFHNLHILASMLLWSLNSTQIER